MTVEDDAEVLILTVVQGPDQGRRFELPDDEPQIIGRSSEALPLTDQTISRRHAELTPDDGRWFVNDQHSANGTFLNGKAVTVPTMLRRGDRIRTGETIILFGGVTEMPREDHPIRVVKPDQLDAAVERTVPSCGDSLIMAVPDPSSSAQDHLQVLYQMMQVAGSTFDRKELLERVMDLIFEHFDADRGFILLQMSPTDRPVPMAVRFREEPQQEEDRRIHISRTIVRHVLKRAEGVLSSNAMADSRFAGGDSIQRVGIRSAICVPMQFRERVYGVIHIDSLVANYTFTEEQLRLLTAIGAQVGMALGHTELYEQGVVNARLAAVGETVASLSHSVRNMLQGMRGGAELVELALRKQNLDLVQNGWHILSRNLDRVYQLTMNMLAYSKNRQPEMVLTQLASVLDEVVAICQTLADRNQVKLIKDYEADLPPVPLDPNGIQHAVINLVQNAIDAVDTGTGEVIIRSQFDPTRLLSQIIVSDNGPGIAPEQQEKIFQPFYSTKGQRGTGLGLAVSKKIVEEHGGQLEMLSEPNRGTTFTIILSAESNQDPAETH